ESSMPRNRVQSLALFIAFAGSAFGGVAGCNNGECLDNRQFFAQKVWGQVMSKTCIKCHSPEGVAADRNAKLLLLTSAYPAFVDTNFATVTDVSKIQYDGTSELLLKPIGKLDHGGGMQVQEGSDEYNILKEFVKRTQSPVTCPGQ